MVDRSKEDERSLLQIVLNESLTIAPKLNATQLDIIACSFNIAYTLNLTLTTRAEFCDYLNNGILVFADAVSEKHTNYKHLEYVGCAAIRAGSRNIVQILRDNYKAFFSKGFELRLLDEIAREYRQIRNVVIRCLNNKYLFQAGGMTDATIKVMCAEQSIPQIHIDSLIQIIDQSMMNIQEAEEHLNSLCPKFASFLEATKKSQFISLDLTSVGIAIAHAHSRRNGGFDADLSIWI